MADDLTTTRLPARVHKLAYKQIVGINDKLEVSTGYDAREYAVGPDDPADVYEPHELWTRDERITLADEMIARWQRFKERG